MRFMPEAVFRTTSRNRPKKTFLKAEDFRLSPESKCIDSGYNLKNIIKNNTDMDGDLRPNTFFKQYPRF